MEILYSDRNIAFTQKELGAVYTPADLSSWVASLSKYHDLRKSCVIDPAAGDGSLLKPFAKYGARIVGCDLIYSELEKIRNSIDSAKTYNFDVFQPAKNGNVVEFWKQFLKDHEVSHVISNPPWGGKILQKSSKLKEEGLSLASGQFDSYELFIELMIRASTDGVSMSFIIPDSIFLPEHKELRKLILENCIIHGIYRLGEGIFENVFRGTVVLVLEKGKSDGDNNVRCLRLTKEWRTNIKLGNVTYDDAADVLTHLVPQKRFSENEGYLFDIDTSENDITVKKIEQVERLDLKNVFISGRGVELSKTGKVLKCESCGTHFPFPRKKVYLECECGKEIVVSDANSKKIISNKKLANSVPMIVGEDVCRYQVSSTRYIKSNIKGINYKRKTDLEMGRVLVRKTGVGINSTVIYSDLITNQVVFHLSLKDNSTPRFFLEYFQGILSSRVLLAYYLKKFGDSEWRSHAYITQKIIYQLPVPLPKKGEDSWENAKKIALLVQKKLNTDDSSGKLDFEIERLVIKQYELDQSDVNWIVETLKTTQQLKLIASVIVGAEVLLKPKGCN